MYYLDCNKDEAFSCSHFYINYLSIEFTENVLYRDMIYISLIAYEMAYIGIQDFGRTTQV